MKLFESGCYSIVANSGVDLCRRQVSVPKQFLNGTNVRASFQHVRCKTVTQHVGIHDTKLCTSSDLLHDTAQCAAGQWALWFWALQWESLKELIELALRCGTGHCFWMTQPFAVLGPARVVRWVLAPTADPLPPSIGNVAILLWNDVLKKITRPAPPQVFQDCFRRRCAEINHALLALRCNWKAAPSKVNVLDTNCGDLPDAAACRVKHFGQRTISRGVGGGDKLSYLRLSKRLGQLTHRSAGLQESGCNAVHNSTQIEKVEETAQSRKLVNYKTVRPCWRKCLGNEVSNVHRGHFTQRFVSDESAEFQRNATIGVFCAECVVLGIQPAPEAMNKFTIETLGGQMRHAAC
jgi:hypothetical protein